MASVAVLVALLATGCSTSPEPKSTFPFGLPTETPTFPPREPPAIASAQPTEVVIPELSSDIAVTVEDFHWVRGLVRKYGCNMNFRLVDETVVEPGNARFYRNQVDVSKYMPQDQLPSMALHECAHARQQMILSPDEIESLDVIYPPMTVDFVPMPTVGWEGKAPEEGMKARVSGMEQNADCIARIWGATIFHYTEDCSGDRGEVAQSLADGVKP